MERGWHTFTSNRNFPIPQARIDRPGRGGGAGAISGRGTFWKDAIAVPILRDRVGPVEHPAPEETLAALLSAPLACCRWELEQRRMTPPSNFALRIIVEEDATLVRCLNASYADAAPDGGLDAVERDALLDVLGRHFTGRPWPRSGGMDATRRFMADLQDAMVAARWSVDLFAVA
jgi:hypothetical protein